MSNFPQWDNVLCHKNQKLMLLVAKLGIFRVQLELFRGLSNPGREYWIPASIHKGCPMLFPVKYAQKCVQNVKLLSLCLYSFRKMVWFSLALQQSKVQLAPPTRFKMVVLTPKLDMRILLSKFLLRNISKVVITEEKLSNCSKWVFIMCFRLVYE